jgi:hypothetical protein
MDLGVGDFHGKSPDGGGGAQICVHIEKIMRKLIQFS